MPVVLITNNTLATRAGSEMYVRDIASALLRRGWKPVACSNVLGDVAAELRALSVPVVNDPRSLASPPDIIHAHHHLDAMAAIAAWPGVPVIAFCHGWVPWEETPFRHPQIVRHVAVDQLCRERLVVEHGIPAESVELLPNFVDLRRIPPRATPPSERPRRALVFSNSAQPGSPTLTAMETACARHGISLEVVGVGVGKSTSKPELLLAQTDLVFAKGRAVFESLAAGCGAIVSDTAGLAGLVTQENFTHFRGLNFGFRLMVTGNPQPTADDFAAEIARWKAADVAAVSKRVREECGIDPTVEKLIALYGHAMSQPIATDESALRAASTAMSGYLLSLGATFKGFGQQYAALSEAHHQSNILATHAAARAAALDERLSALAAESASKSATIDALQQRLKRFSGLRRFLPRWLAVQKK